MINHLKKLNLCDRFSVNRYTNCIIHFRKIYIKMINSEKRILFFERRILEEVNFICILVLFSCLPRFVCFLFLKEENLNNCNIEKNIKW